MPIPRPIRHDLGYVNRKFREVDNKIREGRRAISVDFTTLDGDFIIRDGTLILDDHNGERLFTLGSILPALADGTPQRGFIIHRNDGTRVLALYDGAPGDGSPAQYRQAMSWWDRSDNVVVADDTDGPLGAGLARPYIPFTISSAATAQTVTSGTFVTTHDVSGPRQHPRMVIGLNAIPSDGTTAGELRVVLGGTTLAGPTAIPAGSGGIAPSYLFALPAGVHMDVTILNIQCRRTAGAGNISVRPFYAYGAQT